MRNCNHVSIVGSSAVCMATLLACMPVCAQQANSASDERSSGQSGSLLEEVVVTARARSETLISVPVSVSAISTEQVERYRADDLTKIGELVPSVVVGAYKAAGGGSIAIRGISSPANTTGFEQAVSVAVDGVQTSNGRVAQLGFFDVAQVEVLEGPQALFFGKNSPAGVISIKTAMPTTELQVRLQQSYEFVADETTTEAAISGPVTDQLGARLAFRYRHAEGWLYNDARERPNPFYTPTAPAGVATLPGADRRLGDEDYQGRLTLQFEPASNLSAVFKLFGFRSTDAGWGLANQVIGCPGANPVTDGMVDTAAECSPDNHLASSNLPAAVSQAFPRGNDSGQSYGRLTAWIGSLALSADLGNVSLSSLTGYNSIDGESQFGFDQSAFSQLAVIEEPRIHEFSQELRLNTDFESPLNAVLGAYYQRTTADQYNDIKLRDNLFNPTTGRFDIVELAGRQTGRTYSLFSQLTYDVTDQIELAGGARWTQEEKRAKVHNIYGVGTSNTLNTRFPGSDTIGELQGHFKDDNWSPEATLTWRPSRDQTVYVAYKTGYKSGGFTLSPLQTSYTIGDLDFGPEKVRGFEMGAKGLFADRRLRLALTAFDYEFRGEQVSIYDPPNLRFVIANAGKVKQRGVSGNAAFQVTPAAELHSAFSYAHNRYEDFVGACYSYLFPAGATPANGPPPANCSYVPGAGLSLQQTYDGRAPARSPDLTANGGAVFGVPIGSGLKLELTGDAFYSDGYYVTDNLNPTSYQSSFWRFNASLSLKREDGKWDVSLIGRNLTNEYYLLFGADRLGGATVPGQPSDTRATVARGRELAIRLQANF